MGKRLWKEFDFVAVNISKTTIKEAERKRNHYKTYKLCEDCVVALAIKKNRTLKKFKHIFLVGIDAVYEKGTDYRIARLQSSTRNYIINFDAKKVIEPQVIVLTLTERGAAILNSKS